MKKFIRLLLIFIFSFCFIPFVNAEELPQSSVTYFLMYPNGEEDVTESYSIASDVKEKLLYEGDTDQLGQIVLDGWNREGIVRVVQVVPDGYSTNEREIIVDLSKSSQANFVDYKGLTNPTTGRSVIVFVCIGAVVLSTFLVSRRNKKALMIIPIGLVAFSVYTAYAWTNSLVVTVVDGKGKALPNVHVYIYGKPVVDAKPAIKFDANGGNFFDGSTEMYFRIPYNGCTFNEFINSLDSTTNHYLNENIDKAYRSGYSRGFPIAPDNLTNGMVLPVIWSENVNDFLLRLDGNGGVYDYYGESLKSLVFANDSDYYSYVNNFVNTGSYFIGLDDTPTCSRYSSNGLDVQHYRRIQYRQAGEYDQVVYMCWNKKPDGIYVNGTLLRGNTDSCFEESSLEIAGSSYYFWSYDLNLEIFEENNKLYFRIFDSISKRIDEARLNNSYTINSLELVKNGRTLAYVLNNELVSENDAYTINDANKINQFSNLLDELYYNGCNSNDFAK